MSSDPVTTDPAEMVALLDEYDPIERAFQALVILHPEHLTPVSLVKGGAK